MQKSIFYGENVCRCGRIPWISLCVISIAVWRKCMSLWGNIVDITMRHFYSGMPSQANIMVQLRHDYSRRTCLLGRVHRVVVVVVGVESSKLLRLPLVQFWFRLCHHGIDDGRLHTERLWVCDVRRKGHVCLDDYGAGDFPVAFCIY